MSIVNTLLKLNNQNDDRLSNLLKFLKFEDANQSTQSKIQQDIQEGLKCGLLKRQGSNFILNVAGIGDFKNKNVDLACCPKKKPACKPKPCCPKPRKCGTCKVYDKKKKRWICPRKKRCCPCC